MIAFFRKIRAKLLEKRQFNRYFFYIIGEIALVVFGILIALQISNWSEAQKDKTTLKASLQALQINLQEDIENMEAHIQFNHNVLEDINFIYHLILDPQNRNRPFEEVADSMFYIGLERIFTISKSAFQTMESGGHFQLLEDQTLAQTIYEYYNLAELRVQLSQDNNKFVQSSIEPFLFNEMELRAIPTLQRPHFKHSEKTPSIG